MADLVAELRAGPSAGSALLREALAEVGDGVRSVSEADFRILIVRSDLPRPVFNAQLFDADGTFIAMVDAWWQDSGVGRRSIRVLTICPLRTRTALANGTTGLSPTAS